MMHFFSGLIELYKQLRRLRRNTDIEHSPELDWQGRLRNLREGSPGNAPARYLDANCDAVKQVVRGLGPDDVDPKVGAGARVVFNIAGTHIPAFCAESGQPGTKPYKNAYDLKKQSTRREEVDEAIVKALGSTHSSIKSAGDIYFGAVETSGSGVRFYGDFCLVLAHPAQPDGAGTSVAGDDADPRVLDRNSFDLIRAPIRALAQRRMKEEGCTFAEAAARQVKPWIGSWQEDLEDMVAVKSLSMLPSTQRRWTTGQIAETVLQDEDYLEVLYPRSFGIQDLLEVRISAADAAAEGDIADREASGDAPALHEAEWRQQRREARRALARAGVRVRVIANSGRVRGN